MSTPESTRHERLLVTCSPFLRKQGVELLRDELRDQLYVDPKDGQLQVVTDLRIDEANHKIYGVLRPWKVGER